MALCDRVVVLRNGAIVSERTPRRNEPRQLIKDMTGKPAIYQYSRFPCKRDACVVGRGIVGRSSAGRYQPRHSQRRNFGLFALGAGRTELLEPNTRRAPAKLATSSLFGEKVAFADPAKGVKGGGLRSVRRPQDGRHPAAAFGSRQCAISSLRRFSKGLFPIGQERPGVWRSIAKRSHSHGSRHAADLALSGGNPAEGDLRRALMAEPPMLLPGRAHNGWMSARSPTLRHRLQGSGKGADRPHRLVGGAGDPGGCVIASPFSPRDGSPASWTERT